MPVTRTSLPQPIRRKPPCGAVIGAHHASLTKHPGDCTARLRHRCVSLTLLSFLHDTVYLLALTVCSLEFEYLILSSIARDTTMSSHATSSNAIAIPQRKNKHCASASGSGSVGSSYGSFAGGSPATPSTSKRRESLMSETFSRADYTVVNVGEEESPRLITCVKASQGFAWNPGESSFRAPYEQRSSGLG